MKQMICSKSPECGGPLYCAHIKEHDEVAFCSYSCYCTYANGNVKCVEATGQETFETLEEVFKLSPKLKEVFQPVLDDGEPVPKPNLLRKADEFHATENLDLFKQIKEIVKAK